MNMDKFASIAAPIATPLAPAVTLMAGLHDGMVSTGVNTVVAWFPAAMSGLGMELSGMLAGAMTFRAIKERDLAGGFLAALGIIGYIVFAIYGMNNIPHSGVFQAFVMMSLISYFVAAIFRYFEEKKNRVTIARQQQAEQSAIELDIRAKEIELKEREARLELDRINAEKNLQNARNRSGRSGQVSAVSAGQHRTAGHLDAAKAQAVADLLCKASAEGKDPATVSLRDIENAGIVGKSQAAKYKAAALEQVTK